jgi:hypothetical protein
MGDAESVVQCASVTVRRHTYKGAHAMSSAETLFYRCIPRFITHNRDLPHQARYLFVIIAQEIDLDTGKAQITIGYLADVSGLSVRTILRYVPMLEAKGYIRVERAPKGSKITNIYEIVGIAALIVILNSKLYRASISRRRR